MASATKFARLGPSPAGAARPRYRAAIAASASSGQTFVTVYGRLPVLEALDDDRVGVARVLVARTSKGEAVDAIVAAAGRRGVAVRRVAPEKVTRMSGNGRHDQGVVAEVVAPGMVELAGWAPPSGPLALLVLDGVTNPANVGMIIRTAVAAGLAGVVLPRAGVPDVGPLVVKASAGVAYRATLLRSASTLEALEALDRAGVVPVGLRATGAPSIYAGDLPARAAFVLGNESDGVSPAVAGRLTAWRSIPLANGVESLNVASAAAVVAFEVARRQLERPTERQLGQGGDLEGGGAEVE